MSQMQRERADLTQEIAELRARLASAEIKPYPAGNAEAASPIRFNQATFSSLAESTAAGIFMLAGLKVIYANAAAEAITGYDRQELLKMDLTDFIHPDFRELPRPSALGSRPAEILLPRCEIKVITKQGHERWLEVVMRAVEEYENCDTIATIFDVTERKQAEQKLVESRAQLRQVISSAMDAIIIANSDHHIVQFNTAAEQMFGCSKVEALGKPIDSFIPELLREGHEGHGEHLRECSLTSRSGRRGEPIELVAQRANGDPFSIEASISLAEIYENKFYSVIIRDVSERKRVATELERARGEMRAILDSTREAMIFISPDLRIQDVNRPLTHLFDIKAEDALGRNLHELEPLMDRIFSDPDALMNLAAHFATDSEQQFKEVISQSWPEQRQLELFSTPVRGTSGDFTGRLYSFRDVTREREVDRMKTEFVSLAAHELRAPLTGMKGYVEILLQGEAGKLSQIQRKFLTIVGTSTDHMIALINDFLDISRIQTGKLALSRMPLDLSALIYQTTDLLRPQIEAKQQRLSIDVSAGLPPVWGDPDRVIQILMNLISNAIKYTPNSGSIEVRARNDRRYVRIEVQDSGIGIPSEEQPLLFNWFYSLHTRRDRAADSWGLGLPITRMLVELHGGVLSVDSEPGRGSTFGFTLPIRSGNRGIEVSSGNKVIDT